MESYTVRDLGCFVCYLVGGNYYTVYTRVLGGPPDMGKQALCEIPVGSDEFNGNVTEIPLQDHADN